MIPKIELKDISLWDWVGNHLDMILADKEIESLTLCKQLRGKETVHLIEPRSNNSVFKGKKVCMNKYLCHCYSLPIYWQSFSRQELLISHE